MYGIRFAFRKGWVTREKHTSLIRKKRYFQQGIMSHKKIYCYTFILSNCLLILKCSNQRQLYWTIIRVAVFFSYQTTIHRNGIPAAIDFRRNTVIEFRSQTQYSSGWQHGRRRSAAPRHVFFRFLRTLNFTIYIRHFTTHVNDHWSTHLFLLNKAALKTDDSVEEKL